MGKKSKRGGAQVALGSAITNKAVCRHVEELWTKTQGAFPSSLAGQWEEYDTITSLLKVLREKQGPSLSKLPPRREGIAAFEKWLDEHGTEHSNVEIAEYPGRGFGLRAKRNIQMGEKVLVVPERLMMTSESARQGPLGGLISRDRMLQAMANVALAIHLLNERYSPNSFWKPYIDVLPHSYTTPLYFTKQGLQMLQASPCLSEALQQIRSIAKLYAHLHKAIRAYGDTALFLYTMGFYFDDFVWAVSSVMTRQNEIPLQDGKSSALALIPLWDLCNHTNSLMGTDFSTETRSCDCYAACSTKAGEEFTIFYGARTNAELFIHQGFVFPANEHDSLRIKLGLSSAEESHSRSMKSQLLHRMRLPVSGVFHLLAVECPFSPKLRAFVRVFTASPPELEHLLSLKDDKLREALTKLKWEVADLKTLDFLEKRCTLLLQPYKTSVEEDERLLKEGQLPESSRQAIQLRMCEKQILQYAARYAQGAKKLIEIQLGKFKPVACVAKSPPQETNSPELKQNGEENGGKGLEDGGDELRAPSSSKGEENSEDTISATEPPAVGSNEKSDGVEEAMGVQEGETSEQLQEGSNTEQTAATQEHEQQQQKAKEDDDGHKVEGEDGSHEQETNS